MNKIQELLDTLCPNGVEYKRLGDFATVIRGNGLQKTDFAESGVGCIHYGQIYTYYGAFTYETKSFVSPELAEKLKKVNTGDLVVAVTSENVDDVCKCVAWLGTEEIVTGGHSAIVKHNQNPKYLSYYFQSEMFFKQKRKIAKGTKVIEVAPQKLEDIIIPIPPIEVQDEIVKVLDNFTELTAELTAELIARKKQYDYYKNQLLDFDETVEYKTIGEIFDVSDYVANGSFADLRNNVEYKREPDYAVLLRTVDYSSGFDESKFIYIDEHAYNFLQKSQLFGGEIIINNIGAGVGTTFKCPKMNTKMSLAPNAIMVKTSNNDFYYHWFTSKYGQDAMNKVTSKSAMPKFNKTGFKTIKVPVPSLQEQQRIVDILDRFDMLCNDISEGLPAEIEARQKQYAYYRDKLLSFKGVNE